MATGSSPVGVGDVSPLYVAAWHGRQDVIAVLLGAGAAVDQVRSHKSWLCERLLDNAVEICTVIG